MSKNISKRKREEEEERKERERKGEGIFIDQQTSSLTILNGHLILETSHSRPTHPTGHCHL